MTQEFYELAAPSLTTSQLDATDVKGSKLFMVKTPNVELPIYPSPNSNNKEISLFLKQFQVLVCPTQQNGDLVISVDNGLYIQTILPIKGWTRRSYLKNDLEEITCNTYEQLYDSNNEINSITSGLIACLQNSHFVSGLAIEIRKHPIYVLGGLVFLHFMAECIIFADLITDIQVAKTLADAHENWLFMLTTVFILAPYYIAWAAAFGYLQKRAMDSSASNIYIKEDDMSQDNNDISNKDKESENKNDDENDSGDENDSDSENDNKTSLSPGVTIQIFVLLFSIAPIGVCFLIFLDIYLFIEDLIIKPIYLCCRKEMIREESHAEEGYKKLRRVSEVVAETICQSVLQILILIHFRNSNSSLDTSVVLRSLIVSLLVLVVWGVVLKYESNSFGLHFYEYVTVVLQGSFNFVPYLPAIERGKKEEVNWTNFRFDSHSVGLVSKALISPECKLKSIKLSAYSLAKLSLHEARFLGQMLADSPLQPVKVIFSRSRREIEELFMEFDVDNSRTFDFKEFVQLCSALGQSDDGIVSVVDIAKIFSEIADKNIHQVYLTDLLLKIENSTQNIPVVDYSSPIMYALKMQSVDPNLLTFMLASKVCDEITWDYYTTTLVTQSRHKDAIVMCQDKGIPLVVEVIKADNLNVSDNESKSSDPYLTVSISDTGQVKRTETRMKSLNPVWNQMLLFTIPFDDLPQTLEEENNFKNIHYLRNRNNYNKSLNRLEIHFKVYDFDEEEDDDFIGSTKHFIKYTKQGLLKYQQLNNNNPNLMNSYLYSQGKESGKIYFKIYIGTIRYYIKYGRMNIDNLYFN